MTPAATFETVTARIATRAWTLDTDITVAAPLDIYVTGPDSLGHGQVTVLADGDVTCELTVEVGTRMFEVSQSPWAGVQVQPVTADGTPSTRAVSARTLALVEQTRLATIAAADTAMSDGTVAAQHAQLRRSRVPVEVFGHAREVYSKTARIAQLQAELAAEEAMLAQYNAQLDTPLTPAQLDVLGILTAHWPYIPVLRVDVSDVVNAARVNLTDDQVTYLVALLNKHRKHVGSSLNPEVAVHAALHQLTDTQMDTVVSLLPEWQGSGEDLVHAARTL